MKIPTYCKGWKQKCFTSCCMFAIDNTVLLSTITVLENSREIKFCTWDFDHIVFIRILYIFCWFPILSVIFRCVAMATIKTWDGCKSMNFCGIVYFAPTLIILFYVIFLMLCKVQTLESNLPWPTVTVLVWSSC